MSNVVSRRRARYATIPEWIIKSSVSSHAIRLFVALDRHADLPKGAIPSRQTLADEWLHCSLPTIDRAKAELVAIGALTVEKVGRNRNLYILEDQPNSRTGEAINSITGDLTRKRDTEREISPPGGGVPSPLEASTAVAVRNGHPEVGAQQLVACFCDLYQAVADQPAPRRVVGQVAKQVGQLIDEGISAPVVARSLILMVDRRLNASVLPSLVLEAAAGPRKYLRFGRGLTSSMILQGTQSFGESQFSPAVQELLRGGRR